MNPFRFKVIGRVSGAHIAAALAARWRVAASAPTTVLRRHLDTFDWSVWRSGGRLTLERTAGGATARWQRGRNTRPRTVAAPPELRDLADLPAGAVRGEVAAAAGGRALLPVGEVRVRRREFALLDDEGKTRVRVCLDTVQPLRDGARAGSRRRLVTVAPLVGYVRDADAVAAHLRAIPGLAPADDEELAIAAAAAGRRPGDYTSKLTVSMRPGEPAERAVRRVLRNLAATIVANVDGTVRDLDTEFLHDLRVATRRTRTCLGQLPGVLPDGAITPYTAEFRWLATATNPCRDLDVFLAELERRQAAPGAEGAAALAPLVAQLRAARARVHRELATVLTSARFARLMRTWRAALRRRMTGGERGELPVLEVAAERTLHAYSRLTSHARRLTPDAPPGELHRLRIDAKKLRYLIEFFAGLWEPEETKALVAELKLVQDSLGDYHDAWLQGERLAALAPEVQASGAGAATLLAMGRLIAELERRQGGEAARVLARLAAFAAPPFPDRFARLVARRAGA